MAKYSVLFICTANICRSPMAMGLLRERVGPDNQEWRIESAGTWGFDHEPAAMNTLAVLRERGIDISRHASRRVNQEMVDSFNLILTMERGHKEGMRIEFPHAAHKIFLLSEMEDQIYDIEDPMGSTPASFRITANEIDQILAKGIEKITRLADDNLSSNQ